MRYEFGFLRTYLEVGVAFGHNDVMTPHAVLRFPLIKPALYAMAVSLYGTAEMDTVHLASP